MLAAFRIDLPFAGRVRGCTESLPAGIANLPVVCRVGICPRIAAVRMRRFIHLRTADGTLVPLLRVALSLIHI